MVSSLVCLADGVVYFRAAHLLDAWRFGLVHGKSRKFFADSKAFLVPKLCLGTRGKRSLGTRGKAPEGPFRAGVGEDIARLFAFAGGGAQAVRNARRAQRVDPSIGERGRGARAGASVVLRDVSGVLFAAERGRTRAYEKNIRNLFDVDEFVDILLCDS
jgi:hypothetical protein